MWGKSSWRVSGTVIALAAAAVPAAGAQAAGERALIAELRSGNGHAGTLLISRGGGRSGRLTVIAAGLPANRSAAVVAMRRPCARLQRPDPGALRALLAARSDAHGVIARRAAAPPARLLRGARSMALVAPDAGRLALLACGRAQALRAATGGTSADVLTAFLHGTSGDGEKFYGLWSLRRAGSAHVSGTAARLAPGTTYRIAIGSSGCAGSDRLAFLADGGGVTERVASGVGVAAFAFSPRLTPPIRAALDAPRANARIVDADGRTTFGCGPAVKWELSEFDASKNE